MDIKKMNIPTLDGPNWGLFSIHLQAAARILDCWNVIKGEAFGTTPQTYNILEKPTPLGAQASQADLTAYNAAKAVWNKNNAQALGLMQATVSLVIWQGERTVGCFRDSFWKSRGSYNLPPIVVLGINTDSGGMVLYG